jgi:hypothetical protein
MEVQENKMEDNKTPPEPPKEETGKVLPFMRKDPNSLPKVEDTRTPEDASNVIRMIPSNVRERNNLIQQNKEIFLRRQACAFENHYNGGCKCNYCVYNGMMAQRVFEMLRNDFQYQMNRGKMIFVAADMVEILQGAAERVAQYEKSIQGPPPTPPKKQG